ncbi:MAG TPA: hypothetical protein VL588_04675, partial [Bdellovibrionota bacterium]|nr:hypothetical protein [Bdellovibrionota bacterium]
EQRLYNSLVQALAASTDLRIAGTAEGADAIMTASISQADYSASAQTTASKIPPIGAGPENRVVPVEYRAILGCRFSLRRRNPGPNQREGIWSGSFSRSQVFPANAQLGVLGTTTALINDSEFDRALTNLAALISRDAGESLRSYF